MKGCTVKHRSAKAKAECPNCKRDSRVKKVLAGENKASSRITESMKPRKVTKKEYGEFLKQKKGLQDKIDQVDARLGEINAAQKEIRKFPDFIREGIDMQELDMHWQDKIYELDERTNEYQNFIESNERLEEYDKDQQWQKERAIAARRAAQRASNASCGSPRGSMSC